MCWNDGTLQHTTSIPPLFYPSIATSLQSKRGNIVSQRTRHTVLQCTMGLMLAQVRVFPTGGKYRSLLGDFPSRTNKLELKIPNRPRVLPPSGHPAKTVGRSRIQTRARDQRNGMSNKKSKQADGIRSITLRESERNRQRHVCPH